MPFRKKKSCCFSAGREFCALKKEFYKSAFTLAEVLIVLGIIGIIAALTIPTTIQKTQNKEIIVQLKQDYSIMQNAFESAEADNGDPTSWGLTSSTLAGGKALWANMFDGRVKIVKLCEGVTGCVAEDSSNNMQNYRQLNGASQGNTNLDNVGGNVYENAVLANGSTLNIRTYSSDCSNNWGSNKYANGCATIVVDVNGLKKPNQMGRDVFEFIVAKQGILPMGSPDSISAHSFADTCSDITSGSGMGCAAWALVNANMDYLNCTGLDWNGSIACH